MIGIKRTNTCHDYDAKSEKNGTVSINFWIDRDDDQTKRTRSGTNM